MINKYIKKYVSPEERSKIIDELRLEQQNNEISKKSQKFQKIHNKIIQRLLQMTKERYISPEKRKENIDNLRCIIMI